MQARAVAESVERSVGDDEGLTLSFTAKGRTHTYRYELSDDGLRLVQYGKCNLISKRKVRYLQ